MKPRQCPTCRKRFNAKTLKINYTLKSLIEQFKRTESMRMEEEERKKEEEERKRKRKVEQDEKRRNNKKEKKRKKEEERKRKIKEDQAWALMVLEKREEERKRKKEKEDKRKKEEEDKRRKKEEYNRMIKVITEVNEEVRNECEKRRKEEEERKRKNEEGSDEKRRNEKENVKKKTSRKVRRRGFGEDWAKRKKEEKYKRKMKEDSEDEVINLCGSDKEEPHDADDTAHPKTDDGVVDLVSPEKKEIKKKETLETFLSEHDDVIECPALGCKYKFIDEEIKYLGNVSIPFKCPKCDQASCLNCRGYLCFCECYGNKAPKMSSSDIADFLNMEVIRSIRRK